MERALIYFFTFRSHERCKKYVQKEKLQSRERNVCTQQTSFSAIFVLNKITAPIFQIIHIRNKTLGPCVNERVRSKLFCRVFLLFYINVKVRRSPENEEKKRQKKVVIMHTPLFNIASFRAIIR